MAEALLLKAEKLTVRYENAPQPALRGISLALRRGERLAVIGESGSGKSTFVRALGHLLPAGASVSGKVEWPLLGRPPRPGRDLGFVFQDPASSLNPVLTIGEQVAEGAHAHLGLTWRQAIARARDLIARVRLPEPERMLCAYPHQLSGGQRQRVAIAAALAAGPSVLVADEVTSALDQIVQAEIVHLLEELVREEAMTLIFVTHDIALASTLAERIAVFHDGNLVEDGAAGTVIATPHHPYTRQLIAAHIDLATPPLVERARP